MGPSEDNPDPRVESPFWGVPGLRCLPCEERASTSFLRPLSWLCILGGFWAGSPGLSFSVAWECLPGVSFSGDSEVPPEPKLSWGFCRGYPCRVASWLAPPALLFLWYPFPVGMGTCASSTVLSYPKDPKDSQLPPVINSGIRRHNHIARHRQHGTLSDQGRGHLRYIKAMHKIGPPHAYYTT